MKDMLLVFVYYMLWVKKIELFLFYLVEKKVVVFFWNGNGMEDKLSM